MEILMQPQEDLLRSIASIITIGQQATGGTEYLTLIANDNLLEGGIITGFGATDERTHNRGGLFRFTLAGHQHDIGQPRLLHQILPLTCCRIIDIGKVYIWLY